MQSSAILVARWVLVCHGTGRHPAASLNPRHLTTHKDRHRCENEPRDRVHQREKYPARLPALPTTPQQDRAGQHPAPIFVRHKAVKPQIRVLDDPDACPAMPGHPRVRGWWRRLAEFYARCTFDFGASAWPQVPDTVMLGRLLPLRTLPQHSVTATPSTRGRRAWRSPPVTEPSVCAVRHELDRKCSVAEPRLAASDLPSTRDGHSDSGPLAVVQWRTTCRTRP
jgi:hypothetical protein